MEEEIKPTSLPSPLTIYEIPFPANPVDRRNHFSWQNEIKADAGEITLWLSMFFELSLRG